MLRALSTRSARVAFGRHVGACGMTSASSSSSHQPNVPLELDSSFRELLKDVDMSISRHKVRHAAGDAPHPAPRRELEVYPDSRSSEAEYLTSEELDWQDEVDSKQSRRSPAAVFGSQRIGAVILPFELQQTISRLIEGSDKPMLHNDAKRLFADESDEDEWGTSYDVKYKSRHQAARHAESDGTAFASVALPAHYSAVYAVLDHLKTRLGPDWRIDKIIDWGAGTGSGLWASMHSFQKAVESNKEHDVEDRSIANTTISTYVGIDKRQGLVSIGKRLLEGVGVGDTSISWQKSFQDNDKLPRSEGRGVIALSSFMLSSLPTPLARKALVKEMWESGTDMIILIDHNTTAGFENIAEAREYLLRVGRKEFEDPETMNWDVKGSHVVAPCPHDGTCPLYVPGASKLVCGFEQRLQRPAFVRKTKHSGTGHEDTGYSYVVIRRGERPGRVHTKVGRIGEVGNRELEKQASVKIPVPELVVEHEHSDSEALSNDAGHGLTESVPEIPLLQTDVEQMSEDQLVAALRSEAYSWPRLVFPPLKKSGHIIIDGCTQEGKIMRMTIPKSQGKQQFYDARKSGWGDLFPHEPKNRPQERNLPHRKAQIKGADIGKRNKTDSSLKSSYSKLSEDVKKQKKRIRRERSIARREADDLSYV